jgi:metal-responsive CopG/Arc/MetJ family transcriptional regulator
MRKLLVTLDDELSTLLEGYPNQNEIVRKALRLYIGNISTDTVEGLRASYQMIIKQLKEIDSKVDYLAKK